MESSDPLKKALIIIPHVAAIRYTWPSRCRCWRPHENRLYRALSGPSGRPENDTDLRAKDGKRRLFRRARKLQIRSDLRPTPWLLALNYPPPERTVGRPENGIQPRGSSFFGNRGRIDAVAHAADQTATFGQSGGMASCRWGGCNVHLGISGTLLPHRLSCYRHRRGRHQRGGCLCCLCCRRHLKRRHGRRFLARAASVTATSRGCIRSHASNSSLLFIPASGPSRHQRPFAAFSMVAPPRFGKPCRFWRLLAQAGWLIGQPSGSQPPCPARSLPWLGDKPPSGLRRRLRRPTAISTSSSL
jgi:hypothetical protein